MQAGVGDRDSRRRRVQSAAAHPEWLDAVSLLAASLLFASLLFASLLFASLLFASLLFASLLFASLLFASLLFASWWELESMLESLPLASFESLPLLLASLLELLETERVSVVVESWLLAWWLLLLQPLRNRRAAEAPHAFELAGSGALVSPSATAPPSYSPHAAAAEAAMEWAEAAAVAAVAVAVAAAEALAVAAAEVLVAAVPLVEAAVEAVAASSAVS